MVTSNTVLFVNIQSLPTHIDSLRRHILSLSSNAPKIIAVVESQVPQSALRRIHITDYHHIHLPSPDINQSINQSRPPPSSTQQADRGGGVVLYYHISIGVAHLSALSLPRFDAIPNDASYGRTSCLHWFDVQLENSQSPLRLAVVYLSPKTHISPQAVDQFAANITSVVDESQHMPLVIVGDFNLRSPIWDPAVTPIMISTTQRHRRATHLHEQLTDICNLTLLNTHFNQTRHVITRPLSRSVIDLCYANEMALNLIANMDIGHLILADHLPLRLTLVNNQSTNRANPLPSTAKWHVNYESDKWKRLLPEMIDTELAADKQLIDIIALITFPQHKPPRSVAQRQIQTA
jgi:endonuclease/exonuclease/phosphatase family metal-dependent hydrolase